MFENNAVVFYSASEDAAHAPLLKLFQKIGCHVVSVYCSQEILQKLVVQFYCAVILVDFKGTDSAQVVTGLKSKFGDRVTLILTGDFDNRLLAQFGLWDRISGVLKPPFQEKEIVQNLRYSFAEHSIQEDHRFIAPFLQDTFEAKIPSHIKYVKGLGHEIQRRLLFYGFPDEIYDKMGLPFILDEIVCNAIEHGHKNDIQKEVYIRCQMDAKRLMLTVRDTGRGFDRSKVPDPTEDQNLSKDRGRGLFLIERFMDEVIFNEQGNEITVVKYNHSQGLGKSDSAFLNKTPGADLDNL